MSLILDALNRSRQDTDQVPGLGSHHPTDGALPDSEGGIGWVQWLLVAGLALAVLVIGWLLFDRMPSATEAPERSDREISVAENVPARVVAAAPQDKPAPKQVSIAPPQEKVDSASAVPATAAPSVKRPITVAPVQESAPAPVDANVAALYQQQVHSDVEPQAGRQLKPDSETASADAPQASRAEEDAIDLEKLVAEAEAELADTKLQDNGVPFLATLSQQTKDSIPTLMYQRHDYSGSPGKSRVLINGKTLSSGSSTGGVKVVEILPDSAVLEFKGTRFRLRALNSWVNL